MGWAEDYQAKQEETQRRERLHASAGMQYDPGVAARVFGVSAKTKLPSQVVAEDLDNLEKKLKTDEFNYDNYTDEVNGSPVFNRFAAEDPYNFAVLERNRENLTGIERTLEPIFQGWDSGWGMIELAEMTDRRIKGDKREGDEERLKDLRTLTSGQGDYFGVDSMLMKALVMTANQLPIQAWLVGESAEEIMLGGTAGATVGGVAGAAATPMIGGAGALPGVVAGFFGGMGAGFWAGRTEASFRLERGLAFDEYTELGLDEHSALQIANAVGTTNAALESIGLGSLTKRLPGFRKIQKNATDRVIGELFDVPGVKERMFRFSLQYGEGMATELVTEVLQEATLIAGREYLKSNARDAGDLRPEMAPMGPDEFWDSMQQIAVATLYGTSMIASVGPATQLRADSHAANQAKRDQQYLSSLGDKVQNEKLREEAPEAWQALLERWGSDGPVQEFRVNREGWRKYWQGNEIDPDAAAKEMGLNDEQINGDPSDVVIPFAAFVDKIAPTEHFAALQPDMRVDEDRMTQRDAETWFANAEGEITRVNNVIKDQFGVSVNAEMVKDLKDQLIAGAKYTPKAADIQARLHAQIITTNALQANLDPMELYKRTLSGVRSEVPASMQQGTTDMQMDPLLDRIRNNDFPKQREIFGESLIDMIKDVGGIMDEGSELSSRDFGKQFIGVISKKGKSIDAIAELAAEQGYITSHDESLLMEAIDRELSGEQVFSRTAVVDEKLDELRGLMEQAAQWFDAEGMDLNEMSNEDVKEAIKGIKTLEQTDLEAYTLLLGTSISNDPSLLNQVWRKMPRIREDQDFSSVELTDEFEITDPKDPNFGKKGKYTQNAQEAYEEAVNDRNVLKQLLDCVNG